MVGAVGELASMKRRKLWKMGEDGLCCSSSAIQTRLDPSSLLEEQSSLKPPLFLLFLLCCRLPPKLGETARVYRYRYSKDKEILHCHLLHKGLLGNFQGICTKCKGNMNYVSDGLKSEIKKPVFV